MRPKAFPTIQVAAFLERVLLWLQLSVFLSTAQIADRLLKSVMVHIDIKHCILGQMKKFIY
ncbi:hypothetical protein C489_19766 [Natrinema versiforme JCM 10478]|uniref:Uncharacterized protein n=1 Tax=Natrinema versiforme JCM 10478 TaxID=1227496 RepID=L9XNG4_9EURY|nr:hypothetical protein C489_19766 [Natrinema versiforme JCM 10478]